MESRKFFDAEEKQALEKLSASVRLSREIKSSKKKRFFEIVLGETDQKIVRELLEKLKEQPQNEKVSKEFEKNISDICIAILLSAGDRIDNACAEIYSLFGKHKYDPQLCDAFLIALSLGELPPAHWDPNDEFIPKKYKGKNYFELKKVMEEIFQRALLK